MKALISKMQHFSTEDGPGIRTTVFFQGCNLRCRWCHNPEAIPAKPQFLFYKNACTDCRLCTFVCENGAQVVDEKHKYIRENCTLCGLCTRSCRSHALAISGTEKTAAEIIDYILEDRDFYAATDGGVTFSGGEPMLQYKAVAEIAAGCRENGIKVIVDTAGDVPYEYFEAVNPYTDSYYFDLKAAAAADYSEYTGGNFERISENLGKLVAAGKDVIICIPVIPGFNDSFEYGLKFADVLKGADFRGTVCLLPYHRLGNAKYDALDIENPCKEMNPCGNEGLDGLERALKDSFDIKKGGR